MEKDNFFSDIKYKFKLYMARGALSFSEGYYDTAIMNFKKAMNQFEEDHEDYFSTFKKSPYVKKILKEYYITPEFPKMKLLDMAIYYEG